MSIQSEEWRQIPDIPSNYQVSNLGNVRKEGIGGTFTILRRSISDGYYTVCFEGCQFRLHILVAKAFIPNPDPEHYTEVNHKDRNKLNPCASNLEWMTHSKNVQHAIRTGSKNVRPVRCMETNQLFLGATSAGTYLNIPTICIQESIKSGDLCFGFHFKYDDNITTEERQSALFLANSELIELSKTCQSMEDIKKYF